MNPRMLVETSVFERNRVTTQVFLNLGWRGEAPVSPMQCTAHRKTEDVKPTRIVLSAFTFIEHSPVANLKLVGG